MKICVFGTGSIGTRHISNLRKIEESGEKAGVSIAFEAEGRLFQ